MEQKICNACGGGLKQENEQILYCENCGRKYYISVDQTKNIKVRVPMLKMMKVVTVVVVALVALCIGVYRLATIKMVGDASRFSVVFRDFLSEVYNKPAMSISEEDLEKIKYLKIEKDGQYVFTYSFFDYYETDPQRFQDSLLTASVEGTSDDFLARDVSYFSAVTRLELYADVWENYTLPKENKIRYICCRDGYSKDGKKDFFDRVNPDTLEEVVIEEAGKLNDFSFMDNLNHIKRFTISYVNWENGNFDALKEVEELHLLYPEVEEEKAYEMVEELLKLPSLKKIVLEGKAFYYITETQWQTLKEKYGEKVEIIVV